MNDALPLVIMSRNQGLFELAARQTGLSPFTVTRKPVRVCG